jgi:hypothetical protein
VLSELTAAGNADGGWGAVPGGPSTTECTALSLMALHAHRGQLRSAGAAALRAAGWLKARQRPDGSWPLSDQVPDASWMTSAAVIALNHLEPGSAEAVRGAEWLLSVESRGRTRTQRLLARLFRTRAAVDQDAELTAWPWAADTTAWVEPTSWALIATKQLARHLPASRAAERVRQGELMLHDRMCPGGGWNYGNKRVLGFDLEPYPDTTALALLALHDTPRTAAIHQSVATLRELVTNSPSGLVLSLAVLSLQLYGDDAAPLRAALRARFEANAFRGESRTLALALLALDGSTAHFEVPRHG